MRYVLAPLAGFTDAPFRRLCFEGGADLCYGEMVSAAGLAHGSSPTRHLLETMPGEGEKTRRIISMEDWIKVPIVSREWTACCGAGLSAADITNWDEGIVLVDRTKLYRFDDKRMPFAVHCEGDCMESAGIKDGDLAIINPAEDPQQGAVVLASVAGSLSLKRYYSMPNGDVILRSDLGQTRLTASDMERDEFMVRGVLVGTYQGRPKPLPL